MFHPSATVLVPAFKFDYPNEIMSWRYAISSKFSECLPATHSFTDGCDVSNAQTFKSSRWTSYRLLLTCSWLKCGSPLSSHPFREDNLDGHVGNMKSCPGDMQSLPSNFGCKCRWLTHCDVTFLQDDVVLWGDELRLWEPSINQCHFTRRAGGVNEEAQRSLLPNFMDGLRLSRHGESHP